MMLRCDLVRKELKYMLFFNENQGKSSGVAGAELTDKKKERQFGHLTFRYKI